MAKPYTCPVCQGRGFVLCGFYASAGLTSSVIPEQCRSCNGAGIVWDCSISLAGPFVPQDINKKEPPPVIGDPECDTHSLP